MTPRTGRPKSDNPKRNSTRIRMTDEEVEKLKKSADALKSVIAQIEL